MPKPYGNAAQRAQNNMYIQKFKEILSKRGTKGLIGLKKQFKIMDADGSGALSFSEFRDAILGFKLGLSEEEAQLLFSIFDKNGDGQIQFEEFMSALLGPFSDARRSLVQFAFNKIDANGNGVLELTEVKMKFNPARHP